MRTPRRRAVEILLLLLAASPSSGTSITVTPETGIATADARGTAAAITGVVVDEQDRPVANAEVEAAVTSPPWGPSRQRTRTGAAGRFLVPETAEGWFYFLRVSRPGYAPAFLKVVSQAGSEYRLTLRPGATVSGRVVDEAGRPVRDARIDLFPDDNSQERQDLRIYRSRSGADGGFEIPDLPPERFVLRVAYGNHLKWTRTGLILPRGPERVDLGRLALPGGKVLTGRVLDAEGHPVAGVQVWSEDPADPGRSWKGVDDPRLGPAAVSGPDGGFAILRLSQGQSAVFCRPGFETASQSFPATGSRFPPVFLKPALPGPRVSGRVLDENRRPIPGARVRPGALGGDFLSPDWRPCDPVDPTGTVTDHGGRFSLPESSLYFISGSRMEIWAEAPGYLREIRDRDSFRKGQSLEIVLSRGTTLSGQVLARDGSPAAGARVYAGTPLYEEKRGTGRAPETRTDARGRYRLTGVRPGWRDLWAEHPELGEARRRIELSTGATRIDLTLDGQRERTVQGFVAGPGGEPLAGVQVQADDFMTHTRDDGSFRLVFPRGTLLYRDGLAPLLFSKPGYASAVHPIEATATPIDGLEIRLEKAWPLTGGLLGIEPEDLGDVEVQARRGGETRPGKAGPAGTYRIDGLEPGTWTVTASLDSWVARGTVEVGEEEASLDLRFPGLQKVHGRVLDLEGNPVSQATLRFQDPAMESMAPAPKAYSGDDGTFSIELAEGTYRVQASGSDWGPISPEKPVTVGTREVDDLEIRLGPGAVLQGKILGMPDGASGRVTLFPFDMSGAVTPDGGYDFRNLSPGEWEVEAKVYLDDDVRTGRSRITLAPGAEKVQDLDLSFGKLTLSGLLDSGDEPLSAGVTLLNPDGQRLTEDDLWVADSQGRGFRFGSLRPGTYILRIRDFNRDRIVQRTVELSSDQTVTIDLLHP